MGKKLGILTLLAAIAMAAAWSAEPPKDPAANGDRREDVPLAIPDEARRLENPVSKSAEAIEGGRVLFQSQCVMCHGPKGDGKGDLAVRLGLNTPDFTDPERQKARTDGELHYILTQGHGEMPGQGQRLPENWKWELIHYIRSLAREPSK